MAEAVVGSVLGKLANIIENEMKHLGGVGEKVQLVQRELIRIQCCLRDADMERKDYFYWQYWLNDLCDVAYRIEYTIDTFFLEVEDHGPKDPNFLQNPNMVQSLHKLGTELNDIVDELERIYKRRLKYGIVPPQNNVEEAVIMPFRRPTYQEVDETEVVGMEADKENILKLLRAEETPRRAVITIVGVGGVGKTTLANMVYRSVRAEFEYHIMLSVSFKFNLIDLVRKMLRELKYYIPIDQDLGDLIRELRSLLSSRRYLIILDDVPYDDVWNQLEVAFPDVENGSRILVTSRLLYIAIYADYKMPTYRMQLLSDRKSPELLLKKALPCQEPDKECPSELFELAYKLSKKCEGLPLALIVLGGVLSTKGQDSLKWKRVLDTLHLGWNDVMPYLRNILDMSYQDMPYYLKACVLYLAFFPENYEISAKHLIRMWVAEGLISCKGTTTKEEMAENYLEELSQRQIIQVSSRSIYGLIKSCKVHDIIHGFAREEASLLNFSNIFIMNILIASIRLILFESLL